MSKASKGKATTPRLKYAKPVIPVMTAANNISVPINLVGIRL